MAADLSIITLSRNLDYFTRMSDATGMTMACSGLAVNQQRILVNNANSMPLTAAALKRGWMVIEPGHNTTFSEGNNLGAKAADGHWLLLLNDDLVPAPRFLEHLWAHRKSASVVGAMLVHEDGTVNHAGTRVMLNGSTDHIGRGHLHDGRHGTGAPAVPAVTFAAVLVNANLYQELGGLDERYRYGWEDTDFCMRVLRAGGTIRCARAAVAVHEECGTRPRGGTADAENLATFMGTWRDEIPGLLQEYVRRMAPESVEGAG